MVRIKSITIHNFGPYIDEVIEFPEMDGVCFVWGENGSGKTTLLNIFKYAFFGTLFDGKYNQRSKAKAMNYHSNERYFGVTMEFDSDSSTYRLTRNQRLKDNVVKAVDNSSFKEELTLIKDGEVLSPDETKHTLNQLIPEDISQFFFFDSEKLGLFENLMDEDDTNGLGQKVKESIEKILGIPVLKNCVNIMGDITSMYDDKISKATKEDDKQKGLSEAFNKLTIKLSDETESLKTKTAELEDLKSRQESLTEMMRENQKIIRTIERKRNLEEQLKTEGSSLEEIKTEMVEPVSEIWRSMLVGPITEIDAMISKRHSELETKINLSSVLEKASESDTCPVCGTCFDSDHPRPKYVIVSEAEKEEFYKLAEFRRLFAANLKNSNIELVKRTERELMKTRNHIHSLEKEIEECENQIGLTTEETMDIEKLQIQYKNCSNQIAECSKAISEIRKKIDEDTELKEKITQNMKTNSSGESARLFSRQELYENLKKAFELSIDHYCESMKTKVEKDASEFFLKVDESGYYSGLKINNNYGLELVDRQGNIVPAPSTGYQHMIALSLIRGIHKNAPIEGPAIADYLFGHIDDKHRPLVAKATPYLADQVMVLAFHGEFDQNELREILKGDLVREYSLIRREPYSTNIEIQ